MHNLGRDPRRENAGAYLFGCLTIESEIAPNSGTPAKTVHNTSRGKPDDNFDRIVSDTQPTLAREPSMVGIEWT